jgi:hypothetical protein
MTAMPTHRFHASGPASPLEGVSAEAWQSLVAPLEAQPAGAVSDSGCLGAYSISPRRLVELGYATNLRREDDGKRQVCDFVLPWTQSRFLADPIAQYAVLVKSMRAYYDALRDGEIEKSKEMSVAGALAVLHVGGRGALKAWPKLLDNTRALYVATQGAF